MPPLTEIIQSGGTTAWVFAPSAILLSALHGLEPGHSKTMMAGFIVAIRGSVTQAVMLGLSATLSHTAIVWIIALIGLHYGAMIDLEANEPYFQMASGGLIMVIACWTIWRTWMDRHGRHHHHDHDHDHDHDYDHDHDHHDHDDHGHGHDLASHPHAYDFDAQDAHSRAHGQAIVQRFHGRTVTTGQIILFGLTGGLIPCPASVTILVLCLQLRQVALGMTLVLCFSIGLALTLVGVGVIAAIGMNRLTAGSKFWTDQSGRLPYLSGAIIALAGFYVLVEGLSALG
jgi:ABC-type nickel/cobalt efflux system permease component RcnA